MPYIPPQVAEDKLSRELSMYLGQPRRGKVRDTYMIPGHPNKLLVVATNRVSIFDFVLGSLVNGKGAVLTAMTVMWLTKVLPNVRNHLVAWSSRIDQYLPRELHDNPELQSRALVVESLQMIPVECIMRGYLTGTGWAAYKETQKVCGIELPAGLHDGSELPHPIFTPTTKADVGHDEHLDAAATIRQYGTEIEMMSRYVFSQTSSYARFHHILLADTKLEFGRDIKGDLVLADEVVTPDSSRFWHLAEWIKAKEQQAAPAGYDKQHIREYGKSIVTPFHRQSRKIVGIQNLNPTVTQHQEFVGRLEIPPNITDAATQRYQMVQKMLTH